MFRLLFYRLLNRWGGQGTPRPFPAYPAGVWQAPAADAASLGCGTLRLKVNCDRFLALNLETQPEILTGGQTVVSVTGTLTGTGITASDYSVNTAGTMVGVWCLATVTGTATVKFRAVLSDGTSVVVRTCAVEVVS